MANNNNTLEATQREPLIVGSQMRCPRCKELHQILQYKPMETIKAFENELNPIYKCRPVNPSDATWRGCGFIFSPSDWAILTSMVA